jgi:hypothetical protein
MAARVPQLIDCTIAHGNDAVNGCYLIAGLLRLQILNGLGVQIR